MAKKGYIPLNGTQSRNQYTSLSGKSAMNLINKLLMLLCPNPAHLPPLQGTQPLCHTDFSVFTSQRLLHCTIFLASCLYYACSVTFSFSVRLFLKLVYGKRGSVREA